MNQKMAMMKNKGSITNHDFAEAVMMTRLCSEPSFDSFCGILVLKRLYA